jgi:sulfur carrier protein ThiS
MMESLAMFKHPHNAEKLTEALAEAGIPNEIVVVDPNYYAVRTPENMHSEAVAVFEAIAGTYD